MLSELFVTPPLQPDTEETRTCGCCLQPLATTAFYTDGKDREGNIRYRRDCKDCYKTTRAREARVKAKAAQALLKPRQRRKKK